MKNLFFGFLVVLFAINVSGQVTTPDSIKSECKNIIGVDATGLLKQFFNFGSTYYYNYKYMINYRRIIKSSAVRFGFSGDFHNEDENTNDTLNDKYTMNTIYLGLGIEHYCYIGKNLNLYFGADLISNYSIQDRKYSYDSDSYSQHKTETYYYGLSPLFGIVFRLNSRLSISTETSFDIWYYMSKYKNFYTDSEHNSDSKTTGFDTQFNAPTCINFRIKF